MLTETKPKLPIDSLVVSEITHQPELWLTTLDIILSSHLPEDVQHLPVILTGAGTSAYAASAIAEAWPGARAIPTTELLLQSSAEIQFAFPSFASGGLLISLARSGDSPESVGVVNRIQRLFPLVRHLAIVCDATGRLAQMPNVQVICLDPRTNDRSLAMTSSFSNLVLAGLCLIHSEQIAKVLPAICRMVSSRFPEMNKIAEEAASVCGDRVVVLASGMHALAQETALKIVELTAGRVVTMPQTFLGLRHGPLSFLREDTAVLCFASSDPEKRRYEADLIKELRLRRFGKLIVLGDSVTSTWDHDWFVSSNATHLPDTLRTPFEIPFSQLLAYHLSVKARVDPDNPSPDGVVTRVVSRFSIHADEVGG